MTGLTFGQKVRTRKIVASSSVPPEKIAALILYLFRYNLTNAVTTNIMHDIYMSRATVLDSFRRVIVTFLV